MAAKAHIARAPDDGVVGWGEGPIRRTFDRSDIAILDRDACCDQGLKVTVSNRDDTWSLSNSNAGNSGYNEEKYCSCSVWHRLNSYSGCRFCSLNLNRSLPQKRK